MTDTPSNVRQYPAEEPGGAEAVPIDTVFALLSSRRRRYVLECLREFDEPLALADLADEVATRESDAPITEIPAESVKRIYMKLYHAHVPRLVDEGVVAYDQRRDTVEPLAPVDQFAAYLELAREERADR